MATFLTVEVIPLSKMIVKAALKLCVTYIYIYE